MMMMMMMMMQVLLSWLESLPKSDTESLAAPPSPGHSHNNSIDSNINTINRRNQTLTRTNPYRHKVRDKTYKNTKYSHLSEPKKACVTCQG